MKQRLLVMKKTILLLLLTLCCGTALAQSNDSLVVLWLSQPGVRPVQILNGLGNDDGSRFDANGDGRIDLITQRDDAEGNLQDLNVCKGCAGDSLPPMVYEDVQAVLTLAGKGTSGTAGSFVFWGFADVDDDEFREAIFFNNVEVALIDPRAMQQVNWRSSFSELGLPDDLRLLGVADLTGDGIKDIVVALPQARQVAILGHNPASVARR